MIRAATAILSLLLIVYFNSASSSQLSRSESLIERFGLSESKHASREHPLWQIPNKVLIWGGASLISNLSKKYPDVTFISASNQDELRRHLPTADIFIGNCRAATTVESKSLRWIQSTSVGIEKCAKSSAIRKAGVLVSNTQKLSGPEIAEHAIAMMTSLNRGLDVFINAQQTSNWNRGLLPGKDAIWELEGRTLLVVGLGGIGKEVAKRGYGLGMKVNAIRNSRRSGPDYVSYVGLSDELIKLATSADVVINTVPLTDKTQHIFNANFFNAMPSHSYFISVGRGASTHTDDLLQALKSNSIAGAGLDVTDPEPLPENHPLWKQPRVIITPHMSARSEKIRERIMILIEENLHRYMSGDAILSEVNLARGY